MRRGMKGGCSFSHCKYGSFMTFSHPCRDYCQHPPVDDVKKVAEEITKAFDEAPKAVIVVNGVVIGEMKTIDLDLPKDIKTFIEWQEYLAKQVADIYGIPASLLNGSYNTESFPTHKYKPFRKR